MAGDVCVPWRGECQGREGLEKVQKGLGKVQKGTDGKVCRLGKGTLVVSFLASLSLSLSLSLFLFLSIIIIIIIFHMSLTFF